MQCILCFLDDNFQDELRNLSHLQNDRFENVLKSYKESFISELKIRKNLELCSEHKDFEKLSIFLKKLELNETENFFNSIIDVYNKWINGEAQDSLEELTELILKNRINKFTTNIENDILYRGRTSNTLLNSYDMFHIPFHKRYLIQNQRFSITGQPVLYLGYSPYSILAELRANQNNCNNVYFSSFSIRNHKFKIFDFRNPFNKYFEDYFIDSMFDNKKEVKDEKELKSMFFCFILSSVCLFKKRYESNGFIFSEEYVLPQLVSQVIKKNKFNGILYPSTKIISEKPNLKNSFKILNKHRENIAIFTNLNEERHYDVNLFNKFDISHPILISDILDIKLEQIEILHNQYVEIMLQISTGSSDNKFKYQALIEDFKNSFSHLTNFETIDSYLNTDAGKIHIFLLYEFILKQRNYLLNDNLKKGDLI